MNEAVAMAMLAAFAVYLSRQVGMTTGGQLSVDEVQRLCERVVKHHFPHVDPTMLRAMVQIESNRKPAAFRFEAHLGEASVGLMQTLLSTARWLWQDMGARAFPEPDYVRLADAETSIYYGAAMVNWLRRYKGVTRSEQWIVESYNGGPGASNSQTQNHYRKYLAAKAAITGG